MFQLCSTCVHLCSTCVLLVFICVPLVFACVHLRSLVFICVHSVLFVFTCVHLCSSVFLFVWCFRLDPIYSPANFYCLIMFDTSFNSVISEKAEALI